MPARSQGRHSGPNDGARAAQRKPPLHSGQRGGYRTALARFVDRAGSLRLALALLPLSAAAIAAGSLTESWYDRLVADELVFGAWWFKVLAGLLAVNILCAALKKRPWKRHQIGFLVTHAGLLTLLAGGAASGLFSVRGELWLVDSDSPVARPFGLRATSLAIDRGRQRVWLRQPGETRDRFSTDFAPGVLPWGESAPPNAASDVWPRLLERLAAPWGRACSATAEDGTRLEVVGYYPHATSLPFVRVERDSAQREPGGEAISLSLSSPTLGTPPVVWLGSFAPLRRVSVGPATLAFRERPLTDNELPSFLSGADLAELDDRPPEERLAAPALELARGAEGGLVHRAIIASPEGALLVGAAGPVELGQRRGVWPGLDWSFSVNRRERGVRPGVSYQPVAQRPGAVVPAMVEVIHCRLTSAGATSDHWIPRSDFGQTEISSGGRRFQVGYNSYLHDLGFETRLDSLRPDDDQGPMGQRGAASQLQFASTGQSGESRQTVSLNNPANYSGFRLYQARVSRVGEDENGEGISRSVILAHRDPGLPLKYAGSTMVALGIVCMYATRSYFFRPRSDPIDHAVEQSPPNERPAA